MLSQPRNTKFRKQQRSFKKKDLKSRDHRLAFGCYGLKSLECSQLKASQLESVRRVIIRRVRKIGKI
jgi:large subunit ribosomal protein L16